MPNNPTLELNAWHALAGAIYMSVGLASLISWVWLIANRRRGRSILPAAWSLDDGPIPARRPWPASTLLAAIGVYILAQFLVAVAFRDLIESVSKGQGEASPSIVLWLTALINLLTIVLIPAVAWTTAGISLDDLGLVHLRDWRRDARAGLLLVLLLLPVIYTVMFALVTVWVPNTHPVFDTMKEQPPANSAPITIISAVFAAPIAEELLFRGVLLGWLTTLAVGTERKRRINPLSDEPLPPRTYWTPNILASFLFAALHTPQWPAPIPLFILSLGLGWLAQRTGRLAAPIVAHMAFNGLSTIAMLLFIQGTLSTTNSPPPAPNPTPPPVVAPAPGLLAPSLDIPTS